VSTAQERTERLTRNEISLRRVNEAIELGRRTREGLVPFVCECGVLGCNAVLELTLEEYDAVRRDGARFIVLPGHQSEVDRVAERGDRYEVVEKIRPGPAELAERNDPRAAGRQG
jgi:hypothetical protein